MTKLTIELVYKDVLGDYAALHIPDVDDAWRQLNPPHRSKPFRPMELMRIEIRRGDSMYIYVPPHPLSCWHRFLRMIGL